LVIFIEKEITSGIFKSRGLFPVNVKIVLSEGDIHILTQFEMLHGLPIRVGMNCRDKTVFELYLILCDAAE
jgi:hypothetical protein